MLTAAPRPSRSIRLAMRGIEYGLHQWLRLVVIARRRQSQAHDDQLARGNDGGALAVVTLHPEGVGGNSKGGVRVRAGRGRVGAPEPDQAVSILAARCRDG